MGLIGRGGPAPRRRARSLEAGLLRLRAAHAPTCGWTATARLAIARAAFRMRLHAAAHAGTSAGGAGLRVVSTRTCRTRRAGAGATDSVRGWAGVPQVAAAAAAAPGSAARAAGFWVAALLRPDAFLIDRTARSVTAIEFTSGSPSRTTPTWGATCATNGKSMSSGSPTPHAQTRPSSPGSRHPPAAPRGNGTSRAASESSPLEPGELCRSPRSTTSSHSASTSTRPSPRPGRSTSSSLRPTANCGLRHLPPTPRQHRRRAARRRATRAAGNAMSTHHAQGGHGRGHGAGDLWRHQRHLEHRNRNRGPHARRLSSGATPRPQLRQEANPAPPWHPARAPCNHRARTLHDTRSRRRESRSTHATAAAAAATGQHHAQVRTPPRTPRAPRALAKQRRQKQRRRTPGTRHHARTTTHDDEKMLRAHTGTKPETPIDGESEN